MHRLLSLLVVASACTTGGDASDEGDTAAADTTTVGLAHRLWFSEPTDGVSEGFDLDGGGSDRGCGIADLEGPDGTSGIDNAFGLGLLPVITAVGGQALPELVQNAVTDGELLIMIEVDGLDGAQPGDCLPARIFRGLGDPVQGGGEILPDQTFDIHPRFPVGEVACAELQDDGSVVGVGFDYRLPLAVFDESIDLTLLDGHFRLTPTDDGFDGVIAGGVSVAEIAANVEGFDAIPSSLVSGVVGALDLWADLEMNDRGSCERVSVTLGFEAVRSFVYDGEAPPLSDTGDTGMVTDTAE